MLTSAREANALINLFHQGIRLTFDKGDTISYPDDVSAGVFYVSEGLVKVYFTTKYDEANLLLIRKKGEILGMSRAVTNYEQDLHYTAINPTVVFYVTSEQFNDFLQTNPTAALPLVDMLVDMYQISSERIMNLSYRTVRERLLSFLVCCARRFGEETPNGVVLYAPLRHYEIASSLSASRETISRELTTLETHGLLSRDKHSIITLKDVEKLNSYL